MSIAYNSNLVTTGLVMCLDAANLRSYPGTGTTIYDVIGNNTHSMAGGASYTTLSGVKCFDCTVSAYYIHPSVGGYHNGTQPPADGSQYWGDIAYFSAYQKYLTDAELLRNFNALRGRYGI
jgi:hypothetical protein